MTHHAQGDSTYAQFNHIRRILSEILSLSIFTYKQRSKLKYRNFRQLTFYRVTIPEAAYIQLSGFGGLEVAYWPLVPKFAGSHPEVKPSVPCRSFTACKRSLNVTWKSAFRQNSRTFLAHSSTFRRWVLSRGDTRGDAWWRKLKRPTQIAQ